MVVLAMPVVHTAVFAALTPFVYQLRWSMRIQLLLALLTAAVLGGEGFLAYRYYPLDRARIICLVATRFFCWRVVFNTLLYVSQFIGTRTFGLMPLEVGRRQQEVDWAEEYKMEKLSRTQHPADSSTSTRRGSRADAEFAARPKGASMLSLAGAPVAQMAASFALLFDVLLGLALQLMVLALTLLPIQRLHDLMLFGVQSGAINILESEKDQEAKEARRVKTKEVIRGGSASDVDFGGAQPLRAPACGT